MLAMMLPYLESVVFQTSFAGYPQRLIAASRISQVPKPAPPFFVLYGDRDPIAPSTQAQLSCAALRDAGAETTCHAELPNAAHAFDTATSVRSTVVADAVASFLGIIIYARHPGAVGDQSLTFRGNGFGIGHRGVTIEDTAAV
jgi:acetyl esterase/lipase